MTFDGLVGYHIHVHCIRCRQLYAEMHLASYEHPLSEMILAWILAYLLKGSVIITPSLGEKKIPRTLPLVSEISTQTFPVDVQNV